MVGAGSSFSIVIDISRSGTIHDPSFHPAEQLVRRRNWATDVVTARVASCVVLCQRESVFTHYMRERRRDASPQPVKALRGEERVPRGPRRARKTGTSVVHAQAPTHSHIRIKGRRRDALAVIPARADAEVTVPGVGRCRRRRRHRRHHCRRLLTEAVNSRTSSQPREIGGPLVRE